MPETSLGVTENKGGGHEQGSGIKEQKVTGEGVVGEAVLNGKSFVPNSRRKRDL